MNHQQPLPDRLSELLANLDLLADRNERIEALLALADRFREVPPEIAQRPFPEQRRVPACESEAFVFCEEIPRDGLRFHFAVENPQGISAKALAVILSETLSEAPLEQVAAVPTEIVFRIFGSELSMGKAMGLTSLVGMVQVEARRRLSGAPATS